MSLSKQKTKCGSFKQENIVPLYSFYYCLLFPSVSYLGLFLRLLFNVVLLWGQLVSPAVFCVLFCKWPTQAVLASFLLVW